MKIYLNGTWRPIAGDVNLTTLAEVMPTPALLYRDSYLPCVITTDGVTAGAPMRCPELAWRTAQGMSRPQNPCQGMT